MNRIEDLRVQTLGCRLDHDEFLYRFHKRYGKDVDLFDYEVFADSFYYALSSLVPNISDGELIVGKRGNHLSKEEMDEWLIEYKDITIQRSIRAGYGQESHMAIDYDLVLTEGLNGIISRIDKYLEDCTEEQAKFYFAAKASLLAVIAHSENYAKEAEHQAAVTTDEVRRAELLEIAEICRRVPANPAESFHEAVQSVHFITHCISMYPFRLSHMQFQLGHPDRYLLPYYQKDIASGKLTRERAQLLLDCLGIQINNRVPRGLSSGYMVGGRGADGQLVENDLTEMLMQVIDDIRLVYPSVGLCYAEGMSDKYLKQACEILSRGRSHPAIFNDDVISKGLQCYGVPEADSHNYIHSTCVEITPVAASNVWVASPYTNMAQLLLNTMTREYDSLDEHINAMYEILDRDIEKNFREQNGYRCDRRDHAMNPLLSCFVNDCLARGLDIEKGGARYNWIMPSFVGMANLVDSLYALKKVVYDEKKYTVCQIKEILDSNFEGNEELRLHLLEGLPKYGNDIDDIDGYFGKIIEHIIAECKKHKAIHSCGDLIPSVFCWEMHEHFGRKTGATPDGRLAGFPLGDGSGPCQGREMNGPTASILSSTKWEHHELIGGVAVNMKFAKSSLGANSLDIMQGLVKAFMQRGGFEMQINVTDRELLLKARENPEQYRDLVVRIGGYSDYFTSLSPQMQAEVILRTEHQI